MERKIVKKFTLPALSQSHVFRTYKITPRQVHAHAYVNAGFLVSLLSFRLGTIVNTVAKFHGEVDEIQ